MSASLEKVEGIFHAAVELSSPEREAFVERSCAGDPDLLHEVQSLLQHHGEPTALLTAAMQPVARDLLQSSAESGLIPGAMLGPYRLDYKLGEGGMGSVYLATDTRLGRRVAIKTVSRRFAGSASARARFLREARSAAALSHPNVAAIYDVGMTGETPWLVMEHVDGVPLRARLANPLGETLWSRYANQIADALAHAHSRGIVHRDIKPENILITGEDHIKVIDFGLARTIQEQSAESKITEPSAFVGTLAYAAPELCAGGAASARSDVYSLGVVLYEMACGKPPFAGLAGHPLVAAILGGQYPDCTARNPLIPAGIAAIIEQAMAREPALRYRDATEVLAALRGARERAGLRHGDAAQPVLAIMDFRNIGGAAEFDWLGTGIAETLSTDLAKSGLVRVASRSRVMQTLRRLGCAQHDAGAAADLGRELGARWIVTGGYQQTGDRIRVTAALVDAAGGNTLAAGKVDGRWTDIFDVQDRVGTAVLQALEIRFETIGQRKPLPPEKRSIAAYEHYVHGRQHMYEMQLKSLSEAIRHFELAIGIDPDYSLAYSGLGTANALQFIHTGNPDHVARAAGYLERAIELDPELGEAYPWLSNIRIRKNDPVGACAAGRKGVELQPDLAEAQYFHGAFHYMIPEFAPGSLKTGILHLGEAIRLQPRFHAAWLVLGASAAFLGKHSDAIRILTAAMRMESEGNLVYRFVGARTLLALAHMRMGSWEAARAWHLESLEKLRGTDHIYTTCFEAISNCGLGENELRRGDTNTAMSHFRHARRMIRDSPRVSGGPRLALRANAGLAASYAMSGDMVRAKELAAEVTRQLEGLAGQTATATFECSLAQLWLQLSATEARIGNIDASAADLDRARGLGWLDAAWLANDPELRPLHGHPAFESFAAELAGAADAEIPPLAAHEPGSQVASGIS